MRRKFIDTPESITRPDERGRVTLGLSVTKGVSRYDVYVDSETGDILLKPFKEIPADEIWLYENKAAKDLVAKGLETARNNMFSKINFNSKNWINDVEDDE